MHQAELAERSAEIDGLRDKVLTQEDIDMLRFRLVEELERPHQVTTQSALYPLPPMPFCIPPICDCGSPPRMLDPSWPPGILRPDPRPTYPTYPTTGARGQPGTGVVTVP